MLSGLLCCCITFTSGTQNDSKLAAAEQNNYILLILRGRQVPYPPSEHPCAPLGLFGLQASNDVDCSGPLHTVQRKRLTNRCDVHYEPV
jgi:hypothetical protein